MFNQKEHEEAYKKLWAELFILAASNEVVEFLTKYTAFLKKDCISNERTAIINMIEGAIKLISGK